jgi:hypothetical protein
VIVTREPVAVPAVCKGAIVFLVGLVLVFVLPEGVGDRCGGTVAPDSGCEFLGGDDCGEGRGPSGGVLAGVLDTSTPVLVLTTPFMLPSPLALDADGVAAGVGGVAFTAGLDAAGVKGA